MKQLPVDVRFIPGWLNAVFVHLRASHQDFDRIVSKHDIASFKIANQQLQTKLKFQNIDDFNFPDAVLTESVSEDEIRFALFGITGGDTKVSDWALTRFTISPDDNNGLVIREDATQPERDLVAALTEALILYRGQAAAWQSSTFLRFLGSVKKYVQNPEKVLDAQASVRYVKDRTTRVIASQPLKLGDSSAPLNT